MSGPDLSALPRAALALALAALLALGACRPEPPPTERPPEPQAQARSGPGDAIQAPQERAEAVEDALQRGADAQRARIDAAEGG